MRSWSLSDLSLNRPITVSMMLLAVFVLGIIGTFRLPLAFMPTENRAWISVRAQVARTSPNVLEREVIRPMEEALAGVRDLEKALRVDGVALIPSHEIGGETQILDHKQSIEQFWILVCGCSFDVLLNCMDLPKIVFDF